MGHFCIELAGLRFSGAFAMMPNSWRVDADVTVDCNEISLRLYLATPLGYVTWDLDSV